VSFPSTTPASAPEPMHHLEVRQKPVFLLFSEKCVSHEVDRRRFGTSELNRSPREPFQGSASRTLGLNCVNAIIRVTPFTRHQAANGVYGSVGSKQAGSPLDSVDT
jgi:hypothetical protein